MLFALHLPDHALNVETTVAATLLALGLAIFTFRRQTSSVARPNWALVAAVAMFVGAVQLVNFPLLDDRTSGHFLGSAVAVVLLGPVYGCAVMTLVLAVQAALLGDGGLTALGANVLNMGLVSPLAAWAAYQGVRRWRADAVGSLGAAVVAGWVASIAAAVSCAVELAASGVGSFASIMATLVGHHALLGLAEGVATAALVATTWQSFATWRTARLAPMLIAAGIALACLPIASELQDTLEAVLEPSANVAAE